MMCVACCVHLCVIVCYDLHEDSIYMVDYVWNTRVEKYNLRGSKRYTVCDILHRAYTWYIVCGKRVASKFKKKIELGCVSGWQLAPLKEKGMNGLVHDD